MEEEVEVEAINWALLKSEWRRGWREGIAAEMEAMNLAGRFRALLMKTFESGWYEGIETERAKVLDLLDQLNTRNGGLGLETSIVLTKLRGLISATTPPPQEEPESTG